MTVQFEVRAISSTGGWHTFKTDSMVDAIRKFRFYYYAGHGKIKLIMNER